MSELLTHISSATSPTLSISRDGTGRVYYTARVQTFSADRRRPSIAASASSGATSGTSPVEPALRSRHSLRGISFRVIAQRDAAGRGAILALTDPFPAGFEPLDGLLQTTASDLARQATRTSGTNDWLTWWRRGTFDHVEKHDDRVVAFDASGTGRHEFHIWRATTAGTFGAAGARVEAMYTPELTGRSAAAMVQIR